MSTPHDYCMLYSHCEEDVRRGEELRALLALGADVDERFDDGGTILGSAANGCCDLTMRICLEFGANPNIPQPWSDSILGDVISQNDVELAKLLIDHGADVHFVYAWGDNLLADCITEATDCDENGDGGEAMRRLLKGYGLIEQVNDRTNAKRFGY